MSVLVFGKTGQVARALQEIAPHVIALDRDAANLEEPESCRDAIERIAPSAVINAAAFTAVDAAEAHEDRATIINGDAPAAMAQACAARDIPFVHLSTDYVFDGSGETPWHPDASPAPINAYGRSKLSGERGTMAAGGRWCVLRTSWVFSAIGSNFVKTMLRLAATRDALSVVDDQIGGPTPAHDIAAACLSIADALRDDAALSGIYHFSGTPDTSWHGFAQAIFAKAGRDVALTPILGSAYPTPAARPMNSRLDCSRTREVFGLARPDWRDGLDKVLHRLEAAT